MNEYNKIIEMIYKYYPRNCSYLSNQYVNSIEHLKYAELINDLNFRKQLSKKSYAIIKSVFNEYHITKWTNKGYPSIHYSVLLHKNQPILDDDVELLESLNGRRIDLEIFISLLENYYYIYVAETTKHLQSNDLIFNYYTDNQFLEESQINRLNQEFSNIGYKKLDNIIAGANVSNVETELLYEGEVKIFNCLFSDMHKNFGFEKS